MKKNTRRIILFSLILGLIFLPVFSRKASGQWVDPPTPTPAPTQVPWNWSPENEVPVNPITQQQTPDSPVRPLLYVADYHTDGGGKSVNPYGTFGLTFTIGNNGRDGAHAHNVVMTFSSADFDPLDGSVITFYEVDAENEGNETHTHTFKVNDMSTWKYSGQIQALTTYTDPQGTPYSDTFVFTIFINQTGGSSTTSATATPTAVKSPQIVVNSYSTDIDPLQPGSSFKLSINLSNAGSADARAVSLVFGGSTITTNPDGSPQTGGVTGSGGDLSVFAPIGKSNVVLLGDIPAGSSLQSEQEFIVNVTASPGAYPLKLSFVYVDPSGKNMIDDQIITLLVYALPQLEFSFYNPVEGMLNVNMPGSLPIQITNLARKSVVLGNLVVTSEAGSMMNNSVFVGALDPGGYFTLDPMFTPMLEGPAVIKFEVRYTDDFNQLRTYNSELVVDVMPEIVMPSEFPMLDENGEPVLDEWGNPIMIDPNFPSMPVEPVEEPGFFAKIWNAIKGFFGFGTGGKSNEMPVEQFPSEGNFKR